MLHVRSAIALSLATLGASGCSSAPEHAILERFFAAARLRDKTALARFAAVPFEPHVDGIVTEFRITSVTREQPAGSGGTTSKDVTIEAPVRLPDGRTVPTTLIVTIQRDVSNADEDVARSWIVVGIRIPTRLR